MEPDPLEVAAWELALDELDARRLPALAVDALVRGLDSPTLLELAEQRADDVRASRELFRSVVEELGIVVPDRDRVVWNLVRLTARGMVEGTVAPEAGCRAIGRWAHEVERRDDLMVFVGLEDEFQRWHLDYRAALEAMAVEEAGDLLERLDPETERGTRAAERGQRRRLR